MLKHRSSLILIVAAVLISLVWYGNVLLSLAKPTVISLNVFAGNTQNISLDSDHLVYSKLGIDVPLTNLGSADPTDQKDWNKFSDALKQGVGISFKSDQFDKAPLVFVLGHSSTATPQAYSAIFAGLNQSKPGDSVNLVINHKLYQFSVTDKKIVVPTDVGAFANLTPTDPSVQRLAMTTCWPVFSTKNRLSVIAERKI